MSMVRTNRRIALNNILLLTDSSEPSMVAVHYAAMIARAYGSKVTALHALLPSVYESMAGEVAPLVRDDVEEAAKAEMERVSSALVGVLRETVIERGLSVWDALEPVLREREIDLIVLGTHGRTGLKKVVMGSAAEGVFRGTKVPVLTIGPAMQRGGHRGGRFHCVLFATELNEVSRAAAPYAVSLAQENQSRLILLHVLPTPKPGKQLRADCLSVVEALHQMMELVPEEAELWCQPDARVEHGEPATQILATAAGCGADLIVLGVRGVTHPVVATRVERAVAYKVVAHAPSPVLTVRS